MQISKTDVIWFNGQFVPWDEARVHVICHALHYGSGVFEGIRAYKTDRGTAIFRLGEHLDRLRYSCEAIRLELPFSRTELADASAELLRRCRLQQGYIRPLVLNGYGVMVLNPEGAPVDTIIACWPWGAYLPHETIDVAISDYIRIHPDSTVADAKICGHYVNSILAVQALAGTDFHEALLLDSRGFIGRLPHWSLMEYLHVGAILSIAGQVGDLAESCLKRDAGVKDSGMLFPGHGGVLDRCDSFLFAAPVLYYMAAPWFTI